MDRFAMTQQGTQEHRAAAAVAGFGTWSLDVATWELTWWDPISGPGGAGRAARGMAATGLLLHCAPQDRPVLRAACRRCVEDGTPFDVVVQALTGHGRRKGLRVIGVAERGAGGEVVRVQGAFQHVHRDAHLRQASPDPLHMDQELASFTQAVAHELRAPLAHVDGFSRALAERLPADADPQLQHFAGRVRAGVARIARLIDALLELSSVGRSELQVRHVDLSAIARDTVQALWMQQPGQPAQVQVEDGLRAWGDARLLRTLLEHLVGNAWKSRCAPEPARIAIGQRSDGTFYVQDEGPGLDPAGSTGIAVAIARRVVERHGGRTWTETAAGTATVFCFTLPDAP
jgi:signal transduction histidine kinase